MRDLYPVKVSFRQIFQRELSVPLLQDSFQFIFPFLPVRHELRLQLKECLCVVFMDEMA